MKMIIYTLQQWKLKFDLSKSDQELIETSREFFNNQLPIILHQLIKDDSMNSGTKQSETD